jgi:hypothetical protein
MLLTEIINIIFGVKFYIKTVIVSSGFYIENKMSFWLLNETVIQFLPFCDDVII